MGGYIVFDNLGFFEGACVYSSLYSFLIRMSGCTLGGVAEHTFIVGKVLHIQHTIQDIN